jgi:peroxiredoxin-like protein
MDALTTWRLASREPGIEEEAMKPLPHRYEVRICGGLGSHATAHSAGLPDLRTAPPVEFDGPGDIWSPEQLLLGSVGSCFVLTFQAIARASRIEFASIAVQTEGVVDRTTGGARFTEIVLRPRLALPAGADVARVRWALEKAERGCLVSASLATPIRVEPEVVE